MADADQLDHLKTYGVRDWNVYRDENPNDTVDFSDADLKDANLKGINLKKVNLQDADLRNTILREANLENANLVGAILSHADLAKANLQHAHLDEADLTKAKLWRTRLQHANFEAAILEGAILTNAKLDDAVLSGANLSKALLSRASLINVNLEEAFLDNASLTHAKLNEANLKNASLRGAYLNHADLTDAILHKADLQKADLSDCIGYVLDENYTRGTKFSINAQDPWSILRRTYTGPRLFYALLFLTLFMIPFIAKSLFWVGVKLVQPISEAAVVGVTKQADSQTVINLGRCLSPKCTDYWILELLIGVDEGYLWSVMILILIAYNVLKGGLTYKVSLLRNEEELSGHPPALKDYSWLMRLHQVVQVLFYGAVAAFLCNSAQWLWITVSLPSQ